MTTQPGLDIISLSQLSFAMLLSRKQFTERVPVDFQVGERKSTAEGVMASTHSSEVLEYGTKIKN